MRLNKVFKKTTISYYKFLNINYNLPIIVLYRKFNNLKYYESYKIYITICLIRLFLECGKPYANVTKLIAYGDPEKYGDSPWHVAIYNIQDKTKPLLICGGTIISPELITSGKKK